MQEGFSRTYRLTQQLDFARVFEKGCRVQSRDRLVRVHYIKNNLGYARLGLAISKRFNPSSVQRNRIKRIIRESFRKQLNPLRSLDLVVMCADAKRVSNARISESFQECLDHVFHSQVVRTAD
ncbi:MAG: ribonuclease P protein component [Gammaproteobacteria bacterium]|nr:MAG: ribonuclease P protein component [Gammaproteobacteria bacterium]